MIHLSHPNFDPETPQTRKQQNRHYMVPPWKAGIREMQEPYFPGPFLIFGPSSDTDAVYVCPVVKKRARMFVVFTSWLTAVSTNGWTSLKAFAGCVWVVFDATLALSPARSLPRSLPLVYRSSYLSNTGRNCRRSWRRRT